MKNKNLNLIVKASLKSRKLSAAMFCFFVVVSFVLVYLAIGIIVPLGQNIDTKINNHILKREIVADMSAKTSDMERQRRLDKISSLPYVVDVYEKPSAMTTVTEQSGVLGDSYHFGFVHKYFTPQILSGRAFCEEETGVALLPDTFEEYNAKEGRIVRINGSDFVGKTLVFGDYTDVPRSLLIVGTYDSTDPIFREKEILVPRAELQRFNDEMLEYELQNSPPELVSMPGFSYIVVVDSPKNTQAVLEQMQEITTSGEQYLNVDADTFNTAFVILLAVTVFFVALTVFGFYMFLKNNISLRTNELALYRAVGYKSRDMFRIIFTEHILLVAGSLLVGFGAFLLLTHFAVNPYLDSAFGNTFMAISVSVDPWLVLAAAAGYVLVTVFVSAAAVKRSEKIDLTVLLRE